LRINRFIGDVDYEDGKRSDDFSTCVSKVVTAGENADKKLNGKREVKGGDVVGGVLK
jgi:hypothetical protein